MAILAGLDQLPGSVRLAGAFLAMPYFLSSNRVGSEPETITTSSNFKIWEYVCQNCTADVDDPHINPSGPGAPSLRGLGCGRMMVYIAQQDELRERDVWYYQQVKESRWPGRVELVEAKGEDHVFHILYPNSPSTKKLIQDQDPIRITPYIIDYRNGTIQRDTTKHPPFFPPPNDIVVQSKDITIKIPFHARNVQARMFLPSQVDSNRRIPILVYFHGGAFCIGSAFSKGDTVYMTRVAAEAHVIALSLNYILYPDGAVPDSYDDAWTFLK
ncbi:hypothetical protein Cgig2_002376 [Carnegiea gigantea]|uniref:Alpha/beta hydrolase fold-3 domain-containing protein n=1 Tax=Carnegiea gigantea TaxID=171969 RepID=A0A9Q1GIG9_9CARY|nr:hypothetical protein Cgig2_002376 [Carnegiea gigantea]